MTTKVPVELSSTPGIVDGSNATAITIDSSERVGIGESSPDELLVIGGDVKIKSTNKLHFTNTSDQTSIHAPASNTIAISTNSSERMRIDSSGHVLVGKTSGTSGNKIETDGRISAGAGSSGQPTFNCEGDTNTGINLPESDRIQLITGGTERMRIASNGSIGMGTTPPSDTHTGWTQLFIGQKGSVISENATGVHGLDGTFVTDNMYVDSDTGAFAYIEANESSAYRQEAGIHQFFTQASGSAGAAVTLSEKMRIDSSGNVGIGGTDPNQALEVIRNSSSGSAGGYAGLSLRNDHSSGYMACQFHEGNTLRGDILFQNGVDAMQFRVGGGGVERMRITDSGTLLISTNAASGLSNSNSNFGHSFGGGQQVNSTNNDVCLLLNRNLGSGDMLTIRNNGSTIGSISQNGSTITYGGTSDYRLKENVTDLTNATTRLKQLKPKRFNYISDETNTLYDGFLAHEVSSVVPEAVVGEKDAVDDEGNPLWQMMDSAKLVPLLVKTIQELEARIATLEG